MRLLDEKFGAFLLVAGAILGFLLLKKHSAPKDYNEIRTTNIKPLPVQGPKQVALSAPAKTSPDANLLQARRNQNIAVLNGIVRVPTVPRANMLRVTIEPKPEAQWCKAGDFDLIKAVSSNTKEKVLTLSLESITKEGLRRHQSFTLGEITSDRAVTFEIPETDGAYGLYLCTDQGKKNSCASKQPIPTEIWSAPPDRVKKMAVDKIFYFQLLHVRDKTLNIIPSQAWGKNNLKQLKTKIGPWMGESEKALDKMDSLVARIQPMPARITNAKIEIPLPYNDLRCVQ